MSDPKRLLDDLGGGELKGLLEAGKSELPNDAQMLALAAKIGVAGALGGLGGAGAAGAGGASGAGAAGTGAGAGAAKAGAGIAGVVKGATAIKVGVAVAVLAGAGAGTVAVTSRKADDVDAKPSGIVASPSLTATGAPSTVTESLPPRVDPLASASANVEPSAKPMATATTKPAAPNPAEEVKMLERAQDALRGGRHAEALSLCSEHAKSFPNGMLAQEREVIAVEALMKTGRASEAKARAEKFKTRFPGSSHTRRIDALVGP